VAGLLLLMMMSRQAASLTLQNGNDPRAVNVRFAVLDRKVVVTYDLLGKPDQKYRVSLFLKKESDPARSYRPKMVEGSIGEGISAGMDREITWELFKEIPTGLDGNDFYFVVTIEEESGKFPWWAGAAVLGAGLIGLLVLSGGSDVQRESTLPPPPGRP
jgi:hypothetical protein